MGEEIFLRRRSVFILSLFILVLTRLVFVVEGDALGWHVDVYTQKETFNGLGFGVPSDAFAPLEMVVLFAYVTYNLAPVQNILISFQVYGPSNNVQNVSFSLVAPTNDVGVAKADFAIPWPSENAEEIVFGNWTIVASTENAYDFVCFRVGWIVEVASLRVVDVDPPQGGWLGVEVSLENIGMTSRNVYLAFVLFDSLRQIVGGSVCNLTLDAGYTNFSCVLQVSFWAAVGLGCLNVSVYALDGAPFSGGVSALFYISLLGDLNLDNKVDVRDVSTVALVFGSYLGHVRWNHVADVNKDGKIDVKDVALVAKNFGKVYSE